MDLYSDLFESMLSCCRTWLRHGPVYTVAMIALALAVSFNLLSIIDLLWVGGILSNPYQLDGELHPPRYLCALLCVVFVANSLLARRQFSHTQHLRRPRTSGAVAPAYLLGSATLFIATLLINLRFSS